jgi:hypothetical protein
MSVRTAVSIALAAGLITACAGPQPAAPQPAAPQASAPTPSGSFTLVAAGTQSPFEWAPPNGHVFCRWYAEPERGDYVWIRLAQTPEQDGDAGPRLDIDVCRLTTGGGAPYTPTPAGAHGSHCAVEPGFAIWWHEGEHAFNSGAAAQAERCWLELEVDESAATLAGKFACAPLDAAPHPNGEAGGSEAGASPSEPPSGSVEVLAGEFACKLERMPMKGQ